VRDVFLAELHAEIAASVTLSRRAATDALHELADSEGGAELIAQLGFEKVLQYFMSRCVRVLVRCDFLFAALQEHVVLFQRTHYKKHAMLDAAMARCCDVPRLPCGLPSTALPQSAMFAAHRTLRHLRVHLAFVSLVAFPPPPPNFFPSI
jgi:hypothetical protein